MGKPNKQFWDERSRKLNKRVHRRKKSYNHLGDQEKQLSKDYVSDYIVDVPEWFSFVLNLEETVQFFNDLLNKMNRAFVKSDFMIQSEFVKVVTTDAIMYLIALMRNCKVAKMKMYSFHGTYPVNKEASKVYMESGLLKFVKSRSKRLPQNSSKMSIMCGTNSDSVAAGKMCTFVAEKFMTSRIYVKELYEVIIEMMSNVFYHAYSEIDEIMIPEWYMYAEYNNDKIKFLFLDTGLGIGKTVKKHSLYEKVINKIGIGSESKLIKSALNGDFRTQTGENNHGKGLPTINDFALSKKVIDFHIISGKGHCWLEEHDLGFRNEDLNNRINGTIYCFTLRRMEEC